MANENKPKGKLSAEDLAGIERIRKARATAKARRETPAAKATAKARREKDAAERKALLDRAAKAGVEV